MHKSIGAQGASLRSTEMSQIHYNQWQLTQMKLLLEQHHQQKFLPPIRSPSSQAGSEAQPFYGAAGGGGGIIIRRKRSLANLKKNGSPKMAMPIPVRSPTVTRSPSDLQFNQIVSPISYRALGNMVLSPTSMNLEPLALSGDAIGRSPQSIASKTFENL